MTRYNVYLPTHSASLDPQAYHLNVVQEKQQELLRLNERYEKTDEKYSKALGRLTWLNACSSSLRVSSEISSLVTLSMFIGLLVSIPLGAISLAGMSVSGVVIALTKKYQQKLVKVTKLTDIVTFALALFETGISKALNSSRIDEREFNMLQALYYELFNDISDVGHKMETKTNSKKSMGRHQ